MRQQKYESLFGKLGDGDSLNYFAIYFLFWGRGHS